MSHAISFDEAISMSDSSARLNLGVLEKPVNHTMQFLKFAVLAVSVAAAVPTAQNLYYSWKHDVPFSEVSHRLDQYDLWMKNLDCKIDYRALSTAGGTKVDVGSCAKTGDIAIKVSGPNGEATYEWIAYNNLQKPTSRTAGVMGLFVTAALAEQTVPQSTAPDADPSQRVAQAGMEVVCEAKVKDQILRIVKDGGKCFRELVSPFKGSIDSREEVPCTTQCTPAG
jgi:hypothetical protein